MSSKTNSREYAETDDTVTAKICNDYDECCTFSLDNKKIDDFKKGALDKFTDPTTLGNCYGLSTKGLFTTTLTLSGNDGWYVDFLQIDFANGASYTCMLNSWLDGDTPSYSPSATRACYEGKNDGNQFQ